MALDLTGPRQTVRRVMSSTCRISRDPEGVRDDVLNPTTLVLEPGTDDRSNIYSGICRVDLTQDGYTVRLPWDAPRILEGDTVVVLTSPDLRLQSRNLKVRRIERTETLVWRTLRCDDITPPEVA